MPTSLTFEGAFGAQIKTFVTPLSQTDVLFYETFDNTLPKNRKWTYGDKHHDPTKFPDHVLVFVQPGRQQGAEVRFYASKRVHEDEYNWEESIADIGQNQFDVVTRTYVTLRSEFTGSTPLMGTLMPNVPAGKFAGTFVLAMREQKRIGDERLDSLFVQEQLVYINRASISKVELDLQTGRSKQSITYLYYKGEVVDGVAIEVLAADPNNNYWSLQEDGSFRELKQLSTNWFAVTESTVNGGGGEVIGPENPARTRVQNRVTPLGTDILFWEVGPLSSDPDDIPAYGTLHYDTARWPNHELVFIAPADEVGLLYRYYWAATRPTQDLYNFEDQNGEQLIRTYFMKREEYLDDAYFATQFAKVGDPLVIAPDRFSMYVFADESVDRSVQELDSLYVVVRRRFLEKVRTREFYDDDIHCDVLESITVIPAKSGSADSSPGEITEIQPVNIWHDLEVTKTVQGFTSPKSLPTLIKDVPFNFPRLLKSAEWTGCAAFANSDAAPVSYDESWYIHYDLVEPTPGPYEARVMRFLTTDANALRSIYPIQKVVTRIETIGLARAYAFGSSKGNTTFADARQLEVPSSIHGDIVIGGFDTIGRAQGQSTGTLFKTPGFDEFSALSEMVAGYEPQQAGYGLYIVSIIIINTTGLFTGKTTPYGTEIPSGGGGTGADEVSNSVVAPKVPTVTMSANNRFITGKTDPGSQVRAVIANTEIGSDQADSAGNFTIGLPEPYLTDRVEIGVSARRSGVNSAVSKVYTFDLAPLAPSATISSSLTTLTGKTDPGATLSILVNGANQKETATVIANHLQELTLTFAGIVSADGTANIDFLSAATGASIPVPIPLITGDTPTQCAVKARVELLLNATIAASWTFAVNGNDLAATAVVIAANDATALMTLTNGGTGITDAVSTITVAGNDPVLITVAGNVDMIVTSNQLAGSPISIPFAVEVGDDPTDVATKAAVALETSVVDDKFDITSSTNTFSIESDLILANDPSLNISISNGTCEGLVDAPISTNVADGGIAFSAVANSSGNYSFAFSPILSNGDKVVVVAIDDGGISPPTTVTASATPPTLNSTPSFPVGDYDTINGTATIASIARAYVDDVQVGSATTNGSGIFAITLSEPLVRGELVRVFATSPSDITIQSASQYINAWDLDLEEPTWEYLDSLGYYGVAPSGAIDIIVRYPDNSDHPATFYDGVGQSRNFNFFLPGENGETYRLFARYAVGDSDFVLITVDSKELDPPTFEIFDRSRNTRIVAEGSKQRYRAFDTSRDGYLIYVAPPEGTTLANMVISFPGQATAPFTPSSNHLFPYTTGAPAAPGSPGVVDLTWRGPMMYVGNAPPGTTDAQLKAIFQAQLPDVMVMTVTATDGRQVIRTFDKATYLDQFKGNNGYG